MGLRETCDRNYGNDEVGTGKWMRGASRWGMKTRAGEIWWTGRVWKFRGMGGKRAQAGDREMWRREKRLRVNCSFHPSLSRLERERERQLCHMVTVIAWLSISAETNSESLRIGPTIPSVIWSFEQQLRTKWKQLAVLTCSKTKGRDGEVNNNNKRPTHSSESKVVGKLRPAATFMEGLSPPHKHRQLLTRSETGILCTHWWFWQIFYNASVCLVCWTRHLNPHSTCTITWEQNYCPALQQTITIKEMWCGWSGKM